MTLLLNNQAQAQAVTMRDAIGALENGLRQLARGDATRRPRIDTLCPTSRPEEFFCLASMEGVIREPGYYALRIKPDVISWPIVDGVQRRVTYNTRPGLYGGIVLLFSVDSGQLLAILNDGVIQHVRVAATAALGMRYLSRSDSRRLGIIGSGGMARTFAEAAALERPIESIHVYSPNRAHLEAYCQEMMAKLDLPVIPEPDGRAAVRGADIASVCTNATVPLPGGDWIEPGMHVTNVIREELDSDAFARIEIVGLLSQRLEITLGGFKDADFAIRRSGGDVMTWAAGQPAERARIPVGEPNADRYPNARYVDCVDWETGQPYTRQRPDEVTMLANASAGTREGEGGPSSAIQGIQFASVGGLIYERALEQGLGTELPDELFLQDIPT
jgi:alanine dehydrogenase